MKIKSALIFACIYLIFICSATVSAQSDDLEFLLDDVDAVINEDIFASLRSVSVSVSFREAPLLEGFAEKQIKIDVETKLRQAGFVKGGGSYVFITVKSITSEGNITSFVIETSLVENFLLARDKTITRNETVWIRKRQIRADNVSKNIIRDAILELVDKFIEICAKSKKNTSRVFVPETKKSPTTTSAQSPQIINQETSPFTDVYVGGNRPPEVEIFNDSDRTLYLDLGQGEMTAYTIPTRTKKIIQLDGGDYNFKAAAPRVIPLQGKHSFQKGHRYTWQFTIVKQ